MLSFIIDNAFRIMFNLFPSFSKIPRSTFNPLTAGTFITDKREKNEKKIFYENQIIVGDIILIIL